MKIHSSVLNGIDLGQAAQAIPGVHLDRCDVKGSRSRIHAFDVALESDGTPDSHGAARRRRRNPGTAARGEVGFAASYADWGHFLAALFQIDPLAIALPYTSGEDFHAQTLQTFLLVPPVLLCLHCGEPVDREPGVGLVCVRSGDDGGTYDRCESTGGSGRHEIKQP